MGRALASASPAARAVWEAADAALGEPISTLAWEGPAEELDRTVNAQPALLAASIAAHEAARAVDVDADAGLLAIQRPAFRAGHSMGQYSAMVAAGVLDLGDAVRLVRERGRLMQESSGDGAMAAIMGLPDERIDDLVAASAGAGIIVVANRNSSGQIVLSGEKAAVAAAVEAGRGLGARRAILLPVSVAAHSPLMADAADGMRRALADVPFADPDVPLLANADATPLTTGEACRAELVDHLTRGVDWVLAVETMRVAGVDTFIEVGPGKVLSGLVRRIAPEAATIAVDDITTEHGLRRPDTTTTQE
jgi:[acyl-carrier-protein] S-malonyltransferase